MNKKSPHSNIQSLMIVANRLEELCDEVTFIGGCVLGLLITDEAAPETRFTLDVDCIVNVMTQSHYRALEKKLRSKGFKEIDFENHPICRWNCDGVLLDVLPTDENILGFSNRWYKAAAVNAIKANLAKNLNLNLKIISAPYFLATKLEAFKDRGKQDFLSSHDLEDIIAIIDGRAEITEEIVAASTELKQYLASEFSVLINNHKFLSALPGHLNYSTEQEVRHKIVLARLRKISSLGE